LMSLQGRMKFLSRRWLANHGHGFAAARSEEFHRHLLSHVAERFWKILVQQTISIT
jgi:hypothetical protein